MNNELEQYSISQLEKEIERKKKLKNQIGKVRCKDCSFFNNLPYSRRFTANATICKLNRIEARSNKEGIWKFCSQYVPSNKEIEDQYKTIAESIRQELSDLKRVTSDLNSSSITICKQKSEFIINKILDSIKNL